MRVVADAGPLHYLVLIGQIDILPRLFANVAVPAAVRDELDQPNTPASVWAWIASPPPWLSVVAGQHAVTDAASAEAR
jgi:predicted nucleic acid-binding protein